MSKIDEIKELVAKLNVYRDEYYNNSHSVVTDFEYDALFDRLKELEKETGLVLSNSPTQTVGYEVLSSLQKAKHNHPMLSLDKTKSVDDVLKFLDNKDGVAMAKMDGLTCSARYLNCKLVSAETRGNGEIGEDILHCAKTIKNLPLEISCKDEVIIDGEVIITYDDFEKINAKLPEDQQYKHPRNLASGSIRQLDSKIAAERNMKFVAWKMIKGCNDNSFMARWNKMVELGFEAVPIINLDHAIIDKEHIEHSIELIKRWSKTESYPIDGCVFGYDDIAYGDSLGATGHHLRSQLAFKFYDELYETTLRNVEWTMGKTSVLTPVAVFDTVEIDGTNIEKASLHNISVMRNLGLENNCTVRVYRANAVIPQIDSAEQDGDSPIEIPKYCPICGGETKVVKDNDSEVLVCTNDGCSGKLLGKLSFFVSKKAFDINGLSEAILEFLINKDWVKKYSDLFHLSDHASEWAKCEGFGKKSVEKILSAIEASRNVDLAHFITALSIPNIGSTASKTISNYFNGDYYDFTQALESGFDFTQLEDFGTVMNQSLYNWWKSKDPIAELLPMEVVFKKEEKVAVSSAPSSITGKNFCITGGLSRFANRDALVADIEAHGGHFVSSVSSKCNYLINNDSASASSKNKKAHDLGIPIITEDDYIKMCEG